MSFLMIFLKNSKQQTASNFRLQLKAKMFCISALSEKVKPDIHRS